MTWLTSKKWTGLLGALLAIVIGQPCARALEVRLTAIPSSTEIAADENLSIELKVESSGNTGLLGDPEFSAPDFDEINSYTSSNGMETTIANGHISMAQTRSMVHVLHPKRDGTLIISNIKVMVDGSVFKAADVSITVRPTGSRIAGRPNQSGSGTGYPAQGRLPPGTVHSPQSGSSPSFFIRTEPSKLKAFKGEQIILTYALYTRVSLMNIQVERYPNPNGFLKEDVDIPLLRGRLDYAPSVVDGKEYRRAVLAQYAIFPLKEGTLPIDTFTAKLAYQPGRTGMNVDDDPFAMLNNFFRAMQTTSETKSSDRVSIEVQPLPGAGQPAKFSGLVGDFDVSATVDKSTVKTGEPITVKVKVAGQGHAGMLEHLNVDWPQDFELYEDKSNTQYLRGGQSERVFEYMLIPRVKGHFELPAIELSMFNPDARAYQTRKSQAIPVEVLEGAAGTVYVPKAGEVLPVHGEDVRYWKGESPETRSNALLVAARGLAGLSFVFAALGLWSLGGSPDAKRRLSQQRTIQAMQDRIKDLRKTGSAPVEVLGEVEALLAQMIEVKYGLAIGSLTRAEVAHALVSRRIDESIAKRVEGLMELVENQRYAPGGGDKAGAARAVEELTRLAERVI